MFKIRKSVFETNSSSTHSFTIDNIKDDLNFVEEQMKDFMDEDDLKKIEKLINVIYSILEGYE